MLHSLHYLQNLTLWVHHSTTLANHSWLINIYTIFNGDVHYFFN